MKAIDTGDLKEQNGEAGLVGMNRNKKGQFIKGHNSGFKGHRWSEEAKEKSRKKMKGKSSWSKGKHLSEKHRRRIGEAQEGKKSHNWKGGIYQGNERVRHSIEFRLWREAVFARDNWTCQKYGIKGGKLHPHHIQNFAEYPELRFAIDNGITFSEKAHREFHKKYGHKSNTQEEINEFCWSK